MTSFLIWWHRVVLQHQQSDVINGPTEAGVKCYCTLLQVLGDEPPRWFPSDGGHGQ